MNIIKTSRSLFIFLFGFLIQQGFSQTEISGKVVDEDNFELAGVSIYVKGNNKGTVTDFYGNYVIEIENPSNTILTFEYLGMITQEILLTSASQEVNVTLLPDEKALSEVIVIGYGTQNKKDVTGAVALVKSEDFEERVNTRTSSLLQGQAAGVQVTASSGKPNGEFSVRVRGTTSITGTSEPLYIVDGIRTSDIRSINPSDIDTINVLKDASSAAIYGASAASGVVLITTKRGTTSKPKVSLDFYTGISQVAKTLPVLNGEQYLDFVSELGFTPDLTELTSNTDFQDLIFRDGVTNNYQASISGKTEKTNYFISAGFLEVEGAVRSNEAQRANFKINLDQEINDNVKVGTRIAYTKYNDVDVQDNATANQGGVILAALNAPPVIDAINDDGTFVTHPFQEIENPLARTDGLERGFESTRFLGNIYAEIKFLKKFKFKSSYGIENSFGIFESFLDPTRTSFGRAQEGVAIRTTDQREFTIFNNILSYKDDIGNHSIEALIGYERFEEFNEDTETETRRFSNGIISTINGGSVPQNPNLSNGLRINNSFIGRLNYNYDNRYLITSNFRADGSSTFGPNNRIGYFPSFSLGWRASNEKFFENVNLISDLKIRAGWGIVGNDRTNNPFASQARVDVGANFPINGTSAAPGTFSSSPGNPSLKWEETTQQNIGIDLSLFDNKIKIIADAYIKTTEDLLLDVPLPSTTGFDSGIQNIGSVENKGVEFTLVTNNIQNDNFKWTTNFNIATNKNEVLALDRNNADIIDGDISGRGKASLVRVGAPIGSFFGFIYGGVDSTTGNAFYIDRNGNSTFDPSDQLSNDDRVIIGDPNPDFTYAIKNTFNYKNFGLNVFFQGSQGNDIFNGTRIEIEDLQQPFNQSIDVLRRWQNPGDITDIPRVSPALTDNSRISTRFVEDGSYLRLKQVSLSYNFPEKLLEKIKMSNLKLYVTGENLLTITNYSGFDPEVSAGGNSSIRQGIDFGIVPQTRNFIFGLNVGF